MVGASAMWKKALKKISHVFRCVRTEHGACMFVEFMILTIALVLLVFLAQRHIERDSLHSLVVYSGATSSIPVNISSSYATTSIAGSIIQYLSSTTGTIFHALSLPDTSNSSETDLQTQTPSKDEDPPPKQNTTVPLPRNPFGIAAGGELSNLSTEDLNDRLDGMQKLGVQWVRFDIDWNNVQYKDATTYDWSDYDRVVNAARARNLSVLGIITYTPKWARQHECVNSSHCAPIDPADYALFAQKVATRYKDKGVHAWEIWNEPNNVIFWKPFTDAHEYTPYLKAAYTAIKAVDPEAIIIAGGLSPQDTKNKNTAPLDFLQGVYDAGGKGYFDAVAHHPYTFPYLPSSKGNHAWKQMSGTNPSFRSIMIANGDGDKKIWMTEFGAPTGGPGETASAGDSSLSGKWHVDEELQALTIEDAVALYRTYEWAGPLFWYMDKDSGTTQDTNENFFGLRTFDGDEKPGFKTLQSIIANW